MLAFLNLGGGEMLLLLVLFLVLFGVEKAPDLARGLGRARAELDHAQRQLTSALRSDDERSLVQQLAFEEERDRHVRGQPLDEEEAAVRRAAEELGIDVEGKGPTEVRQALAERVGAPARPEKP